MHTNIWVSKLKIVSSLICVFLTVISVATLQAGQRHLQSGQKQVQLIELYTSEGCSSCPSADVRISQLLADDSLWVSRIPMAFHVDYWDYLGWKDIFANSKHSRRQRKHHRFGNVRSVYTPGFVIDGQEWTGFFNGADWPIAKSTEPGNLQAIYKEGEVDVKFSPLNKNITSMKLQMAWLGVGLETEVKRGENGGLTLAHNFVVLRSKSGQLNSEDGYQASLTFDSKNLPRAEKYALVVWLEDSRTRKPVQAVGGWIEL